MRFQDMYTLPGGEVDFVGCCVDVSEYLFSVGYLTAFTPSQPEHQFFLAGQGAATFTFGIKTVSSSLENSKIFAPAAQHLEAGLCQPSQPFSKNQQENGAQPSS